MEENLLKLFKLADVLNEKQDKVYAQIHYNADDSKSLQIAIRDKRKFNLVERCEFQLFSNNLIKWEDITKLFENYVRRASNE